MRRLRLAMITRRFWPLVGGAERIMAALAAEFASRQIEVTLLTARWSDYWPAELDFRGFSVVRLPNPPLRFWGTLRYMRALGAWLRSHGGQYDMLYVSMLKHDAYMALRTAGARVPVVLRAEGAGPSGDCVWQSQARGGCLIRRKCAKADAIVAPSHAIEQELLAGGYSRDRVRLIPNGVPLPPPRSLASRAAAREALAAAGSLFRLAPESPLAVYTGRLDPAKGLADLVAAWEFLCRQWPEARLWLVGEGPFRAELNRMIEAEGLTGRVVLAGVFDSVDEILAAADAFVLPSHEEGMSLSLLEAMAAGLPVVATDIPGNRSLIEPERNGLLVPVGSPTSLALAIGRAFSADPAIAAMGAAARELVASRYSLARAADEHLTLFEQLLAAAQTGPLAPNPKTRH